jgi:hypothetical protein
MFFHGKKLILMIKRGAEELAGAARKRRNKYGEKIDKSRFGGQRIEGEISNCQFSMLGGL